MAKKTYPITLEKETADYLINEIGGKFAKSFNSVASTLLEEAVEEHKALKAKDKKDGK
jgi:hypothetical protein